MSKQINAQQGIYDARSLGTPKMLILGLQHTFAMFGATVLVPIITGLNVSTALLAAGLGTLLFHLITGGKVPAFLGSSFAFLGGFSAVKALELTDSTGRALTDVEKLPYACGGIVIAGLVYLLMSGLITAFGVKRVMRFFPPVVTGPIIIAIGLILAPSAVDNIINPVQISGDVAAGTAAYAPLWMNWVVAFAALAAIVICNIWGKGMIQILPILIGVAFSYLVAVILTLVTGVPFVNFQAIASADWVGMAPLTLAKFDVSAIITMVPISLATMMEHIGDIAAISATTGKNYLSNPGLNRTLLGDGLATSLAGIFGGPANTTYGENTGVLALTKVYDPRVMRIAACFAILLSFVPKFGDAINTIPTPIIGGISFVLYGMISAIGVRNVVENQVDFTNSRNLIIAATILVSALGFGMRDGITFNVGSATINLSGLAIAAIVGILLNAILPGNDYVFQESEEEK